MEKRRNVSSIYPHTPHDRVNTQAGEKSKGYRKGLYDRDARIDKNSEKKKGGIEKRKKPYGKRMHGGKSNRPSRFEKKLPPITADDQVTDGRYRGMKTLVSASPKMAPTPWQLRVALFKFLFRKIRAKRFLDLCAGAGTVGLDAISRGALISTFVERKAKNCSLIRENLETLGISEGHGEIVESELETFLINMSKRRRSWDVVYFSPPNDYNYDIALEFFKDGVTIEPGGVFVIEHHAEMFFPEELGVLGRRRVSIEGDCGLSIYDRE
jgi:16S rRNA (guanine(966)-N(2))-methyltransferase RsmD